MISRRRLSHLPSQRPRTHATPVSIPTIPLIIFTPTRMQSALGSQHHPPPGAALRCSVDRCRLPAQQQEHQQHQHAHIDTNHYCTCTTAATTVCTLCTGPHAPASPLTQNPPPAFDVSVPFACTTLVVVAVVSCIHMPRACLDVLYRAVGVGIRVRTYLDLPYLP